MVLGCRRVSDYSSRSIIPYLKKSESWRKNHLDDREACSALLCNMIVVTVDEHVYEQPVGFYANQPN